MNEKFKNIVDKIMVGGLDRDNITGLLIEIERDAEDRVLNLAAEAVFNYIDKCRSENREVFPGMAKNEVERFRFPYQWR